MKIGHWTISSNGASLPPALRFFAIQILNYIRYLTIAPVIVFLIGGALLVLAQLQSALYPSSETYMLSFSRSFSFDGSDLLKWYGFVSFVFYAIGTILEKVSNRKRLKWSLKKKISVLTLVLLCEYTASMFLVSHLRITEGVATGDMYTTISIFFGFIAMVSLISITIAHYLSKLSTLFATESRMEYN